MQRTVRVRYLTDNVKGLFSGLKFFMCRKNHRQTVLGLKIDLHYLNAHHFLLLYLPVNLRFIYKKTNTLLLIINEPPFRY